MTIGNATALGQLPITYQAKVNGVTRNLFTVNADGTVSFHLEAEELATWADLDPNNGIDIGSLPLKISGYFREATLGARAADNADIRESGATVASANNYDFIMSQLLADYAAGRETIVPNGTWKTAPLLLTAAQFPNGHTIRGNTRHAILQLMPSATPVGGNLYVLRAGMDNLTLDLTIDMNRDSQSSSTYATAGGAAAVNWNAVMLFGADDDNHMTDADIKLRVLNSVDFGVHAQYIDHSRFDVECNDSGAAFRLGYGENNHLERLKGRGIDNKSGATIWKTYQHAWDLAALDGLTGGNIDVIQSGYGTIATGALSNWFSCGTLLDVKRLRLRGMSLAAPNDNTMTKSVGFSAVNVENSDIDGVGIQRFTSVNAEFSAVENFKLKGDVIDGGWLKPNATDWPNERSTGIHFINKSLYRDLAMVGIKPNKNLDIEFNQITGCLGPGVICYLSKDTRVRNAKIEGNRDGVIIQSDNTTDAYSGGETQVTADMMFPGCDISGNERHGVWIQGGDDITLRDTIANDNGQAVNAPTAGACRDGVTTGITEGYGIYQADGSVVVARNRFKAIGCTTQDTQRLTTIKGSANPSDPTRVSVSNPARFRKGRYYKFKLCGAASADLKAYVVKIDDDEIIISSPILTFNTVTKTGKVKTVGTALSYNGSGASPVFRTDLVYRQWMVNGGVYRLPRYIVSDTSAILNEAFPSNLTNVDLVVVEFTIEEMPSQTNGYKNTNAARDAGAILKDHDFGLGNVSDNTSLTAHAEISLVQWATPLRIPATAFYVVSGTPTLDLNGSSTRRMYAFQDGGTERIEAVVRVPKGVVGKIRPVLHWTNNGAGSGNVVWRYRYHFVADGATSATAGTSVNFTVTAAPAQDVLKVTRGAGFTLTEDALLFIAIDREGANAADTLVGDAGLFALDLEIV